MPIGSTTTNHALEAFNNHALATQLTSEKRFTMNELLHKLDSFQRSRSCIELEKKYPICALDVRVQVFTTTQRLKRVKAMFSQAEDLRKEMQRSENPLFIKHVNNRISLLSEQYRNSELSVPLIAKTLENVEQEIEEAKFRAENILKAQSETNFLVLPEEIGTRVSTEVGSVYSELKNLIDTRFYSIHILSEIYEVDNIPLQEAKKVAEQVVESNQDNNYWTIARHCLDNGKFFWFGDLQYRCSCSDYARYKACKHSTWATIRFHKSNMHFRVDPRPLASRKSAGRPKNTGSCYSVLSQTQILLF